MDEPMYSGGGDLDFYEAAVRTGYGGGSDLRSELAEEQYAAYVQRGKTFALEKPRKDLETTYDKWLHSVADLGR
jgi:hypothetical protein